MGALPNIKYGGPSEDLLWNVVYYGGHPEGILLTWDLEKLF